VFFHWLYHRCDLTGFVSRVIAPLAVAQLRVNFLVIWSSKERELNSCPLFPTQLAVDVQVLKSLWLCTALFKAVGSTMTVSGLAEPNQFCLLPNRNARGTRIVEDIGCPLRVWAKVALAFFANFLLPLKLLALTLIQNFRSPRSTKEALRRLESEEISLDDF
jgi:hypothetical protein